MKTTFKKASKAILFVLTTILILIGVFIFIISRDYDTNWFPPEQINIGQNKTIRVDSVSVSSQEENIKEGTFYTNLGEVQFTCGSGLTLIYPDSSEVVVYIMGPGSAGSGWISVYKVEGKYIYYKLSTMNLLWELMDKDLKYFHFRFDVTTGENKRLGRKP